MAGLTSSVSTLVLGGCSSTPKAGHSGRPVACWPIDPARPTNRHRYTDIQPATPKPVAPPASAAASTAAGFSVIDRSKWTGTGPVRSKCNPMHGISKITIHHEGWTPVYFTDTADTAERLEKIRNYHVGNNRWGDIGYHYIIDRAGRVWEGRAIQYQGAHVKNNNEHNIGILVLGNFEKQSPSSDQLRTLYSTTQQLSKAYSIEAKLLRSHKEINPTTCPGRNLQRQMDGLRQNVG